MAWKENFFALYRDHKWDEGFALMQKVVEDHSDELEPYLYINLILKDYGPNGDYEPVRSQLYSSSVRKYFYESYAKFVSNPEYLFYTAKTHVLWMRRFSEGMNDRQMLLKAHELAPDNILYQDGYYSTLDLKDQNTFSKARPYAEKVLGEYRTRLQQELAPKGPLGESIWGVMEYRYTTILGQDPLNPALTWQEYLRRLEWAQEWDLGIALMERIIHSHPWDVNAAIFMNYLLMNLLVEEEHDPATWNYEQYTPLALKYFRESYAKFSDDPEYLYYTGIIGFMSPWFWGIDNPECLAMIEKAHELDPENPVYQYHYYDELGAKNPHHPAVIAFACMILDPASDFVKILLETKGACGRDILGMRQQWAYKILQKIQTHV